MNRTTYNKKAKSAKKYALNFIKRAISHYSKLMKRDSKCDSSPSDTDLVKLHAKDLADSLAICYLVKGESFVDAHNIWYNLDSEPRDLFPLGLTNLLDELCEVQEKIEKDGYIEV